jgi:tRNA(adenine34) deaminase
MWAELPLPWQACLEEAWLAYHAGSVPIGAVVTGRDGSLLSRGRNRITEQDGPHGLLFGHTLAHAEINALAVLPDGPGLRHACTLYTAVEPCPLCLGAIYMSGVRTIRYASRDPYAGAIDLLGKTPYLSRKPVQAIGPPDPDLEDIIMALNVAYGLANTGLKINLVLDHWQQVVPRGVEAGLALAGRGDLERLRLAGASAGEVIDFIAAHLPDEA